MSFLKDFKEFAMKGNIIDMAVGVIIGGAFGAIVSSLVNDIIMPVVSLVTGGDGLKNLKYVIVHAKDAADGVAAVEEVAINYGVFIQNIVDFLIIAFSIFVALRVIMKFKKKEKEEEAAAPAPEPSKEEVLLTEIRDLLKQQAEKKIRGKLRILLATEVSRYLTPLIRVPFEDSVCGVMCLYPRLGSRHEFPDLFVILGRRHSGFRLAVSDPRHRRA